MIKLHLWLGLLLGFFWAIQGLTGALLVFHRELDRIGGVALTDGPMLPINALLSAAEKAAGQPIQRITAVSNDLRLVEGRYNDAVGNPQAVQLDAATGAVVGYRERNPSSPFTGSGWRWIYLVHMALLAGPTGRVIVGISGLFLMVSVGIGLYLAWPKRRQWGAALSVRKWKSPIQKFYGWHRAVGLFVAAALLLLALTGVYMTFNTRLAPLVQRLVPFEPIAMMSHQSAVPENSSGLSSISADDVLEMARHHFPDGKFMNFETPVEHAGYYSVRLTLPSEWRRWSGRAMVQVDATTGAMIAMYDPTQAPLFNHIDDAAYPVHMGEAGGLIGRILTMLAGLSLPFFYATGLLLWLRKRKSRRQKLAAAPAGTR